MGCNLSGKQSAPATEESENNAGLAELAELAELAGSLSIAVGCIIAARLFALNPVSTKALRVFKENRVIHNISIQPRFLIANRTYV